MHINQIKLASAVMIVVLSFAGCGALQLNPVTNEDRAVTRTSDSEKKVTLKESMVWYDRQPPTRGVLFPEGVYTLEAEDSEYFYFKAPAELDYRVFSDGKTTDKRLMPGGLYLSKKAVSMVPAGAYLGVDDTRKTLTWKLGREFLSMRGRIWHKNF